MAENKKEATKTYGVGASATGGLNVGLDVDQQNIIHDDGGVTESGEVIYNPKEDVTHIRQADYREDGDWDKVVEAAKKVSRADKEPVEENK